MFEILEEIMCEVKALKNLRVKKTDSKRWEKESEQLKKMKKLPLRRTDNTLSSGIVQAAGLAKKHKKSYYVYQGNSNMNLVFRVTYKKSDAFNGINNTGGSVLEVDPNVNIKEHILDR